MQNDILTLKAHAEELNAQGYTEVTETTRTVFCEVKSVGMSETYEALAVGLKPELKFVLADHLEYQGEPFVEYQDNVYQVIRTYRSGQTIELVVNRYGTT